MTWFRVDDGFGDHPKVDALGDGPCRDAAIALWTLAGAWAARHLTDGYVSAGRVERIGVKNPIKAAAELVRVGLWDATDDGYQFRNWNEYQPTRAKVEAERGKTADRVRRFRTANDSAPSDDVTRESRRDDESCNAVTSPLVTPPPSRPVPSRPKERESDAREGSPQKPETLAEALGEPPKPPPSSAGALAAEKAREYVALAMTNRKAVPHRDCSQPMAPLWGTLASFAIKAAKMHGTTWDKILKATIRAWADDQSIAERGYPVSFLAANPNQYLGVAVKGGVL